MISTNELIYFIAYLLFCFIIALLLFNNYSFFRKAKGLLTIFIIFIVAVLLHNFLPALLTKWFFHNQYFEEPFFFIIAMLSVSSGLFLLIFIFVKKIYTLIKRKIK